MNGSKKPTQKAPHFDSQPNSPANEIIALVGSNAWQAWGFKANKGKSMEWELLKSNIGAEADYKPLILGEEQLKNLAKLRLAKDKTKAIRLCVFGDLNEAQKTALCLNIAKYTQIETARFADNLGEELDNVSDYIAQLRADESRCQMAESISNSLPKPEEVKTAPYIDTREINNLKGLYYVIPKLDRETGEVLREEQKWICSAFELIGKGTNDQNEHFYIFQWQDQDSHANCIEAISWGDFGTESAWKLIKNKGVQMTGKNALTQHLVDHVHGLSRNVEKWTITHSTGWHNEAYLLPSGEIIGQPTRPVIFKNKSANATGYDSKGTLESWQREIAHYCNKNTSMMLGVAVALASPILRILNADSFGVHLFNSSSKGKTTILNIANSIYGNPNLISLSWDMTGTALNNEASARNDGFISLDELGQAKKIYEVENIAYSLFNEKGRGRGMKEGGNHEINRWKITALSTGEKDVEGFLRSKDVEINAGQLVRLLNVPLIEANELHGFENNKAHADHLNSATHANYGVIGREWIAFLAQNKEWVQSEYKKQNELWQKRLPDNAVSQVQRVASRFAILETALQLAKPLTQWSEQDCREALIKSFNDWIADFGVTDREETKILEFFNGWLDTHAESFFIQVPLDPNQRPINQIHGYRILEVDGLDREHFYMHPKAFNDLIMTSGFPKKIVLENMAKNKMLKEGKEQKTRPFQHKIPLKLENQINSKGKRFYLIYPYLIEDEEE